jgi:hypothetical protein
MDQYSLAEITELYFVAGASMDAQFEYWVSVTFAVVVAGFAAGDRLTKKLSYLAAVLYALATFVLITRFINSAQTAVLFGDIVTEAGVGISRTALPTVIARFLLFALGAFAALYFLLRTRRIDSENG